jgi:ubiquinone/menaquinone biosynthesis C-methylase UbiE
MEEMARVFKPGGVVVVATWCHREETKEALFSASELKRLDYPCAEKTPPPHSSASRNTGG